MATATKICEICGKPFTLHTSPANIAKQRMCSRTCFFESERRIPSWDVAMRTRLKERSKKFDNGCIEYTGQSWGTYGQLEYRRKTYLAHRAAWELENGPIPNGMMICHRCDNPKCINVSHLFLGTGSDNVKDMIAKGRARYAPRKKLSDLQIEIIKQAISAGDAQKSIAERFSISQGMVSMIATGRRHASTLLARS